MDYWPVILILMIVGAETCAMSCLKNGVHSFPWFLAGLSFYTLVAYLVTQTFRLRGMAYTNALWSALSVMATTTVGVLWFREKLHWHDYIAIALIGGGVLIIKSTD